jgi:hypothetical protein
MRYAIVENGVVVNVAESAEPINSNWVASATAQKGWSYDGSVFSPPGPPSLDARQDIARAECKRRILDLVDETAQINLAAAAAAEVLTAEQLTTYKAGLAWIMSLRATWPTLAADADADIYDDANWPQPTQAMRDLAAAF